VGEILLGKKMAAVSEVELGQEYSSEGLPSEQLGPAQNMKQQLGHLTEKIHYQSCINCHSK
jgi:hypothetical protein